MEVFISRGTHPLKNRNIEITDAFFGSYTKLVAETVIPYQWGILNDRIEGAAPSHCLDNFRIAAGENPVNTSVLYFRIQTYINGSKQLHTALKTEAGTHSFQLQMRRSS